jgi:23S rRNA pseudouridine1911/1915/1917 synthase
MSEPITFDADSAGRADAVVGRRYPDAGRRRIAELFAERAVRVDGKLVKKGDRVRAGSTVSLERPPTEPADTACQPDPSVGVTLLVEDPRLLVMNKPAGVPSQPLRAGELGCAANWLVARYPETAGIGDDPREAGLVHRLDIGTSGALMAARDRETWDALRRLLRAGAIEKRYLALVAGSPGDGSCEAPLTQRGKRSVVDYADGLEAYTEWRTVDRFGDLTLLECVAETGRMHQVRAHLAHVGAPIAGDRRYGGPPVDGIVGHFLHAAQLALLHPSTAAQIDVAAPLPADRAALLARLRS